MKIGAIPNAFATLALGLTAWTTLNTAQAQPLYDRVNVSLPYAVTIGEKTLQPGDYVIQQLPSAAGDSRVVLIYSNNGMKFETSAMSIPALDPNTARDTKLVLHQVGSDYYLDKIWIQGKDYGYEFPLPDSVKSREKERNASVDVSGRYSTTQSSETTNTTDTSANAQPVPPPVTSQDTTQAQETTPPPPPPDNTATQTTQPPATDQGSADRSVDSSADRAADNNDATSMPHTSAGWLMMLLSGGTLSTAGMALRRKR